MRTSASPESPTRLLVTDDAARTYRKLLSAKGPLLGFALAPDGAGLHVGGPDDGLLEGRGSASELTQVSRLKVQCLARRESTLWACSSEASGCVAGTAEQTHESSATFTARLHLRDIGGPLQCTAGTSVAKECELDWRKLRSDLGLDDAIANVDAGAANAGAPANARSEDSLVRSRVAWGAALLAVIGGATLLVRARRPRG